MLLAIQDRVKRTQAAMQKEETCQQLKSTSLKILVAIAEETSENSMHMNTKNDRFQEGTEGKHSLFKSRDLKRTKPCKVAMREPRCPCSQP